jgi:hypothetical protein
VAGEPAVEDLVGEGLVGEDVLRQRVVRFPVTFYLVGAFRDTPEAVQCVGLDVHPGLKELFAHRRLGGVQPSVPDEFGELDDG